LALFLFALLASVSVSGDELPVVRQPNDPSFSALEASSIAQEIAALSSILSNSPLGSRRTFASSEWQSGDFARYTAGVLTEQGYRTVLVWDSGWTDGVHTWILVAIPAGETIAWIPVEPSPETGYAQELLGRIPSSGDATGTPSFDAAYISFSESAELPPNLSPVPRIRPPSPPIEPRDTIRISALGSYDPDGDIVLYIWDLGDGTTKTSAARYVRHKFLRAGTFEIILTVVDSLGSQTSTVTPLHVAWMEEPSDVDSTGPGGSCPVCGGGG